MSNTIGFSHGLGAVFCSFAAVVACSAGNSGLELGGAAGTSAGGTAGKSIVDPGGTTDASNAVSDAPTFQLDGMAPDVVAEACATSSAQATLVPSYLQFVVDTSGSMRCKPSDPPNKGDCPMSDPASKWALTKSALASAVGLLTSTTGVGVIFFPNSGLFDDCFGKKSAVPMALLDDTQRQRINQSLTAASPYGGTPTEDAYLFATNTFGSVPPGANRTIVLITDGLPTLAKNCVGDGQTGVPTDPLIADVANAMDAGIRTFVIGSPGSQSLRSALSAMASAGGTATEGCSDSGPNYCHLDMTTQSDFGAAISDALNAIAGKAIGCVFDVPDPGDQTKLDPDRVNVVYSSDGGDPQYILRDPSASCSEGWHYSEDGTQVILCDDTCKQVQSDPKASISVEFGCATKQVS